jgi:hypothetical protein
MQKLQKLTRTDKMLMAGMFGLTMLFFILGAFLPGCGGDELLCGMGTYGKDGFCRPNPTVFVKPVVCGEGTKEVSGKCLPMSAPEQDKECLLKGGPSMPCYYDNDSDGYGELYAGEHCSGLCPALGLTDIAGDCNDADAKINPKALEVCGDKLDNNCDGYVDEGCPGTPLEQDKECLANGGPRMPCYIDNDNDGFGGGEAGWHCAGLCPALGLTDIAGDCNDADAKINLKALEVCGDKLDNNCDGKADEGCVTSSTNTVKVEMVFSLSICNKWYTSFFALYDIGLSNTTQYMWGPYLVNDLQVVKVSCIQGSKICYGAWSPGSNETEWGCGKGCYFPNESSCVTCSKTTLPIGFTCPL